MKCSGRERAARKDYAVEIIHDNASHAVAVSEKIWPTLAVPAVETLTYRASCRCF